MQHCDHGAENRETQGNSPKFCKPAEKARVSHSDKPGLSSTSRPITSWEWTSRWGGLWYDSSECASLSFGILSRHLETAKHFPLTTGPPNIQEDSIKSRSPLREIPVRWGGALTPGSPRFQNGGAPPPACSCSPTGRRRCSQGGLCPVAGTRASQCCTWCLPSGKRDRKAWADPETFTNARDLVPKPTGGKCRTRNPNPESLGLEVSTYRSGLYGHVRSIWGVGNLVAPFELLVAFVTRIWRSTAATWGYVTQVRSYVNKEYWNQQSA